METRACTVRECIGKIFIIIIIIIMIMIMMIIIIIIIIIIVIVIIIMAMIMIIVIIIIIIIVIIITMLIIILTLEGIREGAVNLNPPPSIFLALNFCSLTDYQKLWHNCSLFVKTSFDVS